MTTMSPLSDSLSCLHPSSLLRCSLVACNLLIFHLGIARAKRRPVRVLLDRPMAVHGNRHQTVAIVSDLQLCHPPYLLRLSLTSFAGGKAVCIFGAPM
jgi:hypothetical protein